MKQDMIKEIKYGLRNSRFLILMAGFLFFAILTPVMTKLIMPGLLRSQFPGLSEEALNGMMDLTQLGTVRSYMGDIFEIGSIIVAFTLCGLMAQEIKDNTLVLPLCSGKRFGSIVLSKVLVFGGFLVLTPALALLVDYLYAGMLMSFEISVGPVIRGGILQGLYMLFLLTCLLMWGAILKKPIAAGFASLATSFGLHFVGSILDIHEYLPSGLLNEAQLLGDTASSTLAVNLLTVGAIVLVMTAVTWYRLRTMEWNER